uniref:CCHC-type domain-containing protein n=1 Tax=Photinus pyralis TaxID=7054 RepID=A0A1Y1LUY5_PHOPY
MAEFKTKFEKLDNTNYSIWKFKMELLLIKEGLWKVIKEKAPTPKQELNSSIVTNQLEIDAWYKLDDQARAWIGLSVKDDQLTHIWKAKSAVEAWSNLKEYHEKSTLSNKVHLMRLICSLKMDEGSSAIDHINRMQELFIKLSDIGEWSLSDNWSVAMLLSSLPRSYDTLITALETRPEDELTFALVQQKVIAEYERRLNTVNSDSTDWTEKVLKSVSKEMKCFFCKRSGHMKSSCEKYQRWKDKKKKEDTIKGNIANDREVMFITTNSMHHSGWIVDSGATRHITNDRKFFSSLDESYKSVIEVGNGGTVYVKGKGSGKLMFMDSKDNVRRAIANEVLYAPNMVGNVLSVRRLVENGLTIEFNKKFCEIKADGQQIGVADLVGNLYRLRQSHVVYSVIESNKEKVAAEVYVKNRVLTKATRRKLDNAAVEMKFLGYDNHSKVYRYYDPQRDSNDSDSVTSKINKLDDRHKVTVQEESTVIESNLNQCDSNEEDEPEVNAESTLVTRKSARSNIGVPPSRLIDEIHVANDQVVEPTNYHEAVDTRIYFVKDYVDKGIVKCEYCPTESMIADLLTKPLGVNKYIELSGKYKIA